MLIPDSVKKELITTAASAKDTKSSPSFTETVTLTRLKQPLKTSATEAFLCLQETFPLCG